MNESTYVYTEKELKDKLEPVLCRHGVTSAVLFGSYGKGTADSESDIDLMVDSGLRGLAFVDLMEDIRETTKKDVDLFDVTHIEKGSKIDLEIKNTGRVIYAK